MYFLVSCTTFFLEWKENIKCLSSHAFCHLLSFPLHGKNTPVFLLSTLPALLNNNTCRKNSSVSPLLQHSTHRILYLRSPNGWIFHTKQFSGSPDTSWVSHNSIQFWHHLPGVSIRAHRLRAQYHKTAPSSHFRHQLQVQLDSMHLIDWGWAEPPYDTVTPGLLIHSRGTSACVHQRTCPRMFHSYWSKSKNNPNVHQQNE